MSSQQRVQAADERHPEQNQDAQDSDSELEHGVDAKRV